MSHHMRLASVLLAAWIAIQTSSAASGEDIRPARLSVEQLDPIDLNAENGWKEIPRFLEGASIYQKPNPKLPRESVFQANEGGLVVLAATWTFDGKMQANWGKNAVTIAQLVQDGWEPIGTAIRTVGKRDDHYVIFRRVLKSGERFQFHTRRTSAPWVVLPAGDRLTAVADAKVDESLLPEKVAPAPVAVQEGARRGVARLQVQRLQLVPMDARHGWSELPSYFAEAQVYQEDKSSPRSRDLEFEVSQGGIALLAACFAAQGSPSADWFPSRWTQVDFEKDGWEAIARTVWRLDKRRDEYVIFRKALKAGDRYQVHTRKHSPPLLVVAADKHLDFILKLKPLGSQSSESASQPIANGLEGGGDGLARVRVAQMTLANMNIENGWNSLPEILTGARIFQPTKQGSRDLQFEVLQDGPIVLAASWSYDGSASPLWFDTHTSQAKLVADGWVPIGAEVHTVRGREDDFVLFRRIVKKGERFQFHTRKYGPPMLVLPAREQLPAILKTEVLAVDAKAIASARMAPRRTGEGVVPSGLLALDSYECAAGGRFANRGLLAREIVRQAVLIAGREELGLQTRDVTLGEELPSFGLNSKQLLGIVPLIGNDAAVAVTLFSKSQQRPEILWHYVDTLIQDELLESLVTVLEGHSRAGLREALEKSGFTGQATEFRDDGDVPIGIESELADMTFSQQFHAVRSLHNLVRSEGASPQRLSALSRAYANLGLLTEFHWSGAHAAYKARALLYAERMLQHWPSLPLSHLTRGYARTLVGRHAPAIADFKKAEELQVKGEASAVPAWSRWAEAACLGDGELYSVPASAEAASLARLLALTQLEQFESSRLVVNTVDRVLQTSPDCYRAIDAMAESGSLASKSTAARLGPEVVQRRLYGRLSQWQDLPASIREMILGRDRSEPESEQAARIDMMQSLHAVGRPTSDTSEPSWSALASLIEELSFIHVRREVMLLARSYSVPADELREAREPLVKNTAYRWYLRLHSDKPIERHDALQPLMAAIDRTNLSWRAIEIADLGYFAGDEQLFRDIFALVQPHLDPVMSDLWYVMRREADLVVDRQKGEFLQVCPNAPAAVVADVKNNWTQFVKARADDYRKRFWNVPPVLMAMARRYCDEMDWKPAEELLRRHIELEPEMESYIELSEVYLVQDDLRRWKDTLDEFLTTQPSPGLQHSMVQNRIARALMKRRRWNEAAPYAEAAAESGAGWALATAGSCAEAQQDWDRAETYFAAEAQRYADSAAAWYFFCRRTGQGDQASARDLALQYVSQHQQTPDVYHSWSLAAVAILENHLQQAVVYLQAATKQFAHPMCSLHVALVAHELGDKQLRDAHLAQTIRLAGNFKVDEKPQPQQAILALAKLFQEKVAADQPIVYSEEEVKSITAEADASQLAHVNYVVGRLLETAGQREAAIEYLKRCMAYTDIDKFIRILAGARLVGLSVPASSYRERLQAKSD